MSKLPLVTFGIVNCNRLHYLKSCFKSLAHTTKSYPNIEIIVVDNASIENGTDEFLSKIEKEKFVRVFRQESRDPSNEFAKGLNIIAREMKGDFVIPLQGDMQFIAENWLQEFVNYYQENLDKIGCIVLDAQRTVTNMSHAYQAGDNLKFVYDLSRPPVSGAADVMYSKKIVDMIYPWSENNAAHEGGLDSETDMLKKYSVISREKNLNFVCAMPIVPVSIAIYTDSRGTNARVRGNRRYGDYWPPKKNFRYYETTPLKNLQKKFKDRTIPVGIEEIAAPIEWKAPIDASGSWKKNPIKPEEASSSDFVELIPIESQESQEPDYLTSWMQE